MASKASGSRWVWLALAAVVAIGVGVGGWYTLAQGKPAPKEGDGPGEEPAAATGVSVEVVRPQTGGVRRTCVQPGSVEPFEGANLYAKASGYLVEQTVDIGSHVKKGDLLARISVPEYEKQVERDKAKVRDAQAKVKQMEAHKAAADAEARAATAAVKLAEVMVRAKTAFRHYRERQLNRIKTLALDKAVDEKLVDEQEDYYLSSLESENGAKENVNAATERANAAKAKIVQAEADLDEAKADVGVADAELAKSQVLLSYTVIKSPYTGVVTKRTFHLGDFIKSADQGGTVPMLAVERTDLMRVVVQVPDRDVPYVSQGDPAIVEIDALPGVKFETKGGNKVAVSRWADAEDPATRTMRTEIDVKNTDGKLRHGMYGRVTIVLDAGTPKALRVPSSALVGKAEGGKGTVRVVRGGKVHVVPVQYASDNGVEVEIVSGLSASDLVITRATGPIEEGSTVTVSDDGEGGHGGH